MAATRGSGGVRRGPRVVRRHQRYLAVRHPADPAARRFGRGLPRRPARGRVQLQPAPHLGAWFRRAGPRDVARHGIAPAGCVDPDRARRDGPRPGLRPEVAERVPGHPPRADRPEAQ